MTKNTAEVNIRADFMPYFQAVFEQGIIYGQLWDYLQRQLKPDYAMEILDDGEGVDYFHFTTPDSVEAKNSELDLVIRAIEVLIQRGTK